jgi:photosystem II stability/assembly factor-like uncharacterized protein
MKRLVTILILLGLVIFPLSIDAKAKKKKAGAMRPEGGVTSGTFSGLNFRSIGPAFTSGRIADIAVNPNDHSEYYVAAAAGNVWKTNNNGTTFKPIFDRYGAWSIADVEIDPRSTNVIWVGTGEYNSQRAIGYGDGVYRSEDGGRSFKNMGLKETEHIGRIIIDPRNSHVYVAAQGPLWGPGGERGLYKSVDDGKTWKKILNISENTGITDIVMDHRNPDILYAASYQRRRRVFTLINGGPESAIYKSTDAGANWKKLTNGLPRGDVGRIGLAISPANPDVVYAIIEAAEKSGGFFRTTDKGTTWKKMSSHVSGSPQYYNRIIPDPKDVNKVYSMETYTRFTEDGGKTMQRLGVSNRHVDDHALWIDPDDTRHILIGGDGGLYESFDSGNKWLFKCNLPVTQFYRVALDNAKPFYNVYGGTQDNNSMFGPSRTISQDGIVNDDWVVTQGGDGFESQIDPIDHNIVYAQYQYGGLTRYDKRSGERLDIKPKEGKGEAYRWNWNAPLIVSPHSPTRLYFAANFLFRSDDRGSSWKKVSGDLTRQLNRNKLKVMGKIQSPEAVAKNASTSIFGNITALSESPLVEGLLYVGTDDGLIQISEDGGKNWKKYETFPGVPNMTYVCFLYASVHEADTVYAAFDGRKDNNLSPYLLKSTDRGKTWKSIVSNLPKRGTAYCIGQDHVKKDLLFVGTEFGIFVTIDGGNKWVQLKGGLPTTQVRDLEIQKRENDLVIATFGRGFYVLDDYTPIREFKPEILKKDAYIFKIKDAQMFMLMGGKYGQGHTYFKAKNPAWGATFTYYVKDSVKTLKQIRKAKEAKAIKAGKDIEYPTFAELRAEDNEKKSFLVFTIKDEDGQLVKRISNPIIPGIHRMVWDMSYASPYPASDRRRARGGGMTAPPGNYTVSISKVVRGKVTKLTDPQPFKIVPLNLATLPAKDMKGKTEFLKKVSKLIRVAMGVSQEFENLKKKMKTIQNTIMNIPGDTSELQKMADAIDLELEKITLIMEGDRSISRRNANQPMALQGRFRTLMYSSYGSTGDVLGTAREQYKIVMEEFEPLYKRFKKLLEVDVKKLDEALEKAGAPWTPGRLPEWK